MKLIHLLRHSYAEEGSPDSERSLSTYGEEVCRTMAARIAAAGANLENVHASPARRAQSTIQLLCEQIGEHTNWSTDETLYTFDESDLFRWLENRSDAHNTVMIVGHNPGISNLAAALTGESIAQVPPCSYIRVAADIDSWKELYPRCARLDCVIFPGDSSP